MIIRHRILLVAALAGVAAVLLSAGVQTHCPREANVYLEKQNVLYNGVDNPVSISVSGIAPDSVIAAIDIGTITPGGKPEHYIVNVSSGTKATITVSYREKGRTVTKAQFMYRIKRIPDPVAYVNNVRGDGVVLKEDVQKLTGVFARMENFDFDCAFTVEQFSMSVTEEGVWKEFRTTGPAFSAEMKTALLKLNEEDKVLFHGIQAKGPDGTIRLLNPVVITIK